MVNFPLGAAVTVLRAGPPTRDDYGNDVPGPDTETDYTECAVWPRLATRSPHLGTDSSEDVQARDQVIEGLFVVFPTGADVISTDRVRVSGTVYLVDGEPIVYRSPLTGTELGPQVALTKITG